MDLTNQPEQPIRIEFEVMGLDSITSDFLNWCLKHRDNFEWIKNHTLMEIKSGSVILYFNEFKKICRNDKTIVENE